jgi:hypothetical protein
LGKLGQKTSGLGGFTELAGGAPSLQAEHFLQKLSGSGGRRGPAGRSGEGQWPHAIESEPHGEHEGFAHSISIRGHRFHHHGGTERAQHPPESGHGQRIRLVALVGLEHDADGGLLLPTVGSELLQHGQAPWQRRRAGVGDEHDGVG